MKNTALLRFICLVFAGSLPSAASELGDSVVVFNEIHYHPEEAGQEGEFIELHNQLAVNVDISGWRLEGGVRFDIPEGTVIPGRGYVVVARNPAALQAATGFAGALGPWQSALADGGETLRLYTHNIALQTRPEGGGSTTVETVVGEWRLGEDDAGAADGGAGNAATTGIGGGGDLARSGSPAYSSTAAAGSTLSMQFDAGSAYTGASPLTATDNAGMECWVRPSALGGSGFSFVLSNGGPTNRGYGIVEIAGRWHIIHNGVAASGQGPAVTLGAWTHLRFLRQDGVSRLFVNGADAGLSISTPPTAPSLFHIGANTVTAGLEGRFNGRIDSVRLFTVATTPVPPTDPGHYDDSLTHRRLMSEVKYSDGGKWPVAPDGSGVTLAKIDPQWSNTPSNWAWSLQKNGTPGQANFAAPPAAWNGALPRLAFSEVAGAGDATFRLELANGGATPIDLTGWEIVLADTGESHVFPSGSVAAGGYVVVDETALGFRPADNARLFLHTPGRAQVTDAARVAKKPRARSAEGRWFEPIQASFGQANPPLPSSPVVISEIMHHAFDDGPEQWVELANTSAEPRDLSGWALGGGVAFDFPAGTTLAAGARLVVARNAGALLAKHPGRPIIGDWAGSLSDEGDDVLLLDGLGNAADEVAYGRHLRWPERADQGGSSLELRDLRADNAQPEAWAASDTAHLGQWETISYTEVATNDGLGNDAFRDFLLGLLDAGEILIDDVSVRENPTGTNVEFIQNGSFEGDAPGTVPQFWRCIGNHGQGRSTVVVDPDDSANKCLRVVATGPTDDKHNRIETTFFSGRSVVVGRTYRVSLRLRWMGGSNQVNTRLYFNYLQRTTLLHVGDDWGTPGVANGAEVPNIGPTAGSLKHAPVVSAAGAPVTVSVDLTDPDGVASARAHYRASAGAWSSVVMSGGVSGRWTGTVPGFGAGTTVQFFVRATDGAGAVADFPAAGENGGCFYKVNDGAADTTGRRTNLRVLVTPEAAAALFVNINRMGNAEWPCTVIEDERTVYHQCAMRLHGSASGRYGAHGFHITFPDDAPFRGLHDAINTGPNDAYRELLAKAMLNRAGGGGWSYYDDVGKIVGPSMSGIGLILPARTSRQFVTGLHPGKGTGTLFNHELLYQPNAADANGFKIGNPYNHTRGIYDLADRGADKEAYRWGWQIRSKRRGDDYTKMVRLNRAFGLTGAAFEQEIEAVIDVDQFMRTWAIMSLYGNDDQYGRLYEHNWRLYERPTDGRLIALPWDLDRAFLLSSTAPMTPTTNMAGQPQAIQRLFTVPRWKRLFDSHVLDIARSAANSAYLSSWATHLGAAVGADLGTYLSYAQARSTFALSQLPTQVPFAITTNGGASFSTVESSVTLTGTGWVDVHRILREGYAEPLAVTWTSADTWSVTLPVAAGVNTITLQAEDQRHVVRGSDSIVVTGLGSAVPASAANLVVSELHYHPAAPTPAEMVAGFASENDFEFFELLNIDAAATVDLTGLRFDAGITHAFAPGTQLPPGARLVVPRRAAAFALRHPGVASAGEYFISTDPEGNQFSNGGEKVTLLAADGAVIKSFAYDDAAPWPTEADGLGASLVLVAPRTNPDHGEPANWRANSAVEGDPGAGDGVAFGGDPLADSDGDGVADLVEFAVGAGQLPWLSRSGSGGIALHVERALLAEAGFVLEMSTDLVEWLPVTADLGARESSAPGVERLTFSLDGAESVTFVRVRFSVLP